jgi:hypothetical protein
MITNQDEIWRLFAVLLRPPGQGIETFGHHVIWYLTRTRKEVGAAAFNPKREEKP